MREEKSSPILLWVPGIREGSGGIQNFCRDLIDALAEAKPYQRIHVVIKNDRPENKDPLFNERVTWTSSSSAPPFTRSAAFSILGTSAVLREKPSLIICCHVNFLSVVSPLARLTATPYAVFMYGIDVWTRLPALTRMGLHNADKVLSISRYTTEVATVAQDLQSRPIEHFPCTFNTERYVIGPKPEELLQKYGLTRDQTILLTISRLALSERYKGHEQVLLALPEVRKQIPNVRYLIGGTGDYAETLQAKAKEIGVDDLVIFAGFIPNSELCAHYQLCDMFIMPSQREGFGIVFLEAMACGKPVIAGNRDGSVDALDGGRLGVLVDPLNPNAIAEAISDVHHQRHPNRIIFDPAHIRAEAVKTFGRAAFHRRTVEALIAEPKNTHADGGQTETPSKKNNVGNTTEKAFHLAVLTQLTSPYQVEFFNAVAEQAHCELAVIYLTSQDTGRQWDQEEIRHEHIILSENPERKDEALTVLRDADVAIFNYYTDRFAWEAIRSKSETLRPWVFWGERPGFLNVGPLGNWFRQFALRPLHQTSIPIWGVGQFGIEGYRAEFGPEHDYRNMPYFSDLERFRSLRSKEKDGMARTILYSGSLTRRKGVDLLARAFVALSSEFPDVRLLIVGTGPLQKEAEEILAPCADRVEWAGFQPWHELPNFYARADLFCFPSRYDGWGLALVEALASGIPVIGTDQTGSALDLVAPGKNGWLIRANDLRELGQAMREALTSPREELERMRINARASVSQYSVHEGAERFVNAGCDVVKKWTIT